MYIYGLAYTHMHAGKQILLFYVFVCNHKRHRMRRCVCEFARSHKVRIIMIEGRFRTTYTNIRKYGVRQIIESTLLLSADCHTALYCATK